VPCDSFFIIKAGKVGMRVEEAADEVGTRGELAKHSCTRASVSALCPQIILGPGQYFNLAALTSTQSDKATCVAKEDAVLFRLTRKDFQQVPVGSSSRERRLTPLRHAQVIGGELRTLAEKASNARAMELQSTQAVKVPNERGIGRRRV
jgi:CRP-like cAMP-binding protein